VVVSILSRIGRSALVAWQARGEKAVAFLSADELEARQSARLRAIVRHAWERVPYYREWMRQAGAAPDDVRSAADLRSLPLVDKISLTLEPERFAADGYERRDGLTLLSSGTSGRRRRLSYDSRALFEALAAGRRQRIALRHFVGQEAGYREAVFNREGSVGAQLRRFWESRMVNPRRWDLTRRLFSSSLPFEDLLAGVNEFRPDVIRGYGSHLGAFFRWVAETGRPIQKPRAVTYGADAMPKADRRVIEQELGIPVVSTYQATEALRIGFQCEARRGFHISTDQVAVRVVDASGRDVSPGERGELVVTNLTNRATVVMNYRLGDLVTAAAGSCACGRTLPLIEDIDGRLDDLIGRPGGTWVHALAILPGLQAVEGVQQVQVVQEELEAFRLRVVWARGSEERPGELVARMSAVLGEHIRVWVEPVQVLEQEASGKVKTVICKLGKR
jgi:phenylacetate-CoA ligase